MHITLYFDVNKIKKYLSSFSSSSLYRNNKYIEQNISESKPYNTKIFSIQTLSLSLNERWIKLCKVKVLMNVKVLHSPIIDFYWSYYSNKLLNLYFTASIKKDSVKTSYRDIFSGLSLVPQKILWRHQLIIHYVFGTSSV